MFVLPGSFSRVDALTPGPFPSALELFGAEFDEIELMI
jgi:hypothetical protein